MKNLLIVANWKSNKTKKEATDYFSNFASHYSPDPSKEIIFCPPFTLLSYISDISRDKSLDFKVGGQNVSQFPQGPFTGEVSAEAVAEFCDYCVVGHSERRVNFSEDVPVVIDKVGLLLRGGITPILCISSLSQLEEMDNVDKCIIAYEPLESIGSGNPADPEDAERIAADIKTKFGSKVLYGGSVDSVNVSSFTKSPSIDGVLVGGESLDPQSFSEIIKNA